MSSHDYLIIFQGKSVAHLSFLIVCIEKPRGGKEQGL